MPPHRSDPGDRTSDHPVPTPTERRQEADRQTASLAAVAIILALLTVGLFLVHTLRHSTAVEDCLLAGRRNCDAVVNRAR